MTRKNARRNASELVVNIQASEARLPHIQARIVPENAADGHPAHKALINNNMHSTPVAPKLKPEPYTLKLTVCGFYTNHLKTLNPELQTPQSPKL